jgi:DNA primase
MHYMHEIALRFHRRLPSRIHAYLNGRGISDSVICTFLLGWNDTRITIPIRGKSGRIEFFRLARDPAATDDSPKMLSTPGTRAELYGWEVILKHPKRIVICEGEFDRLVLASHGFAAVTSTGGAATFRDEWACRISEIPEVYLCFDRDDAGRSGAAMIATRIRYARIVTLPQEVGEGGDVTDFFVRLGRSAADFEQLLDASVPLFGPQPKLKPHRASTERHITRLVPIAEVIGEVVPLKRIGASYVGHCPFHDDKHPSFVVFPDTFMFHCFGCGKHGDVIDFLRLRFGLSFVAAAALLRKFNRHGRAA